LANERSAPSSSIVNGPRSRTRTATEYGTVPVAGQFATRHLRAACERSETRVRAAPVRVTVIKPIPPSYRGATRKSGMS
jgi:hypothetical protein